MNRTLAAALAAASVLGIAGGAFAASHVPTSAPSRPAASSSSSSSSPLPSSSPVPATEPLLYADPGEIHDGSTVVRTPAKGQVGDVARVEGGYVLTTKASTQEPAFHLYVVSDSGETTKLADTFGTFAVSPDGMQVASLASTDLHVHIWDVTNGAPRGTWMPPRHVQPNGHVAFDGRTVVVGAETFGGRPRVYLWTPESGSSRQVSSSLRSVTAAGGYVAGLVTSDTPDLGEFCLTAWRPAAPQYRWRNCTLAADHLTGPEFSPNGKRVLASPARADGFGPGSISAVEVTSGDPVATFLAGDGTYGARWADDTHVWVSGPSNADATDTVIRRCNLAGECTVAARVPQRAVVGRP